MLNFLCSRNCHVSLSCMFICCLGNLFMVVFYIVGVTSVSMALRLHRRMSALQESVFPRGVDVQSVDVHQHPVLDKQLAGRMLRRFVI